MAAGAVLLLRVDPHGAPGVVPGLILLAAPFALTKSRVVWTPLCPDHLDYWAVRNWFGYGGAVAIFGSMLGLLVVTGSGPQPMWVRPSWTGLTIALMVWLVALAGLMFVSIRPQEITDSTIRLTGVHAEIVAALDGPGARPRPGKTSARRPPPGAGRLHPSHRRLTRVRPVSSWPHSDAHISRSRSVAPHTGVCSMRKIVTALSALALVGLS